MSAAAGSGCAGLNPSGAQWDRQSADELILPSAIVGEVIAARAEFEAALDAAGVRRWPSRANFILTEIGPRHAEFVRLMSAAGVLVRDRSSDPGCDGCVRITIGTREQMRQATVALNETLAALNVKGATR